tara:strand:- start:6898 stop:7194 length:297 start_codon:yes stop_codon:yes gene_type:complete
MFKVGDLIRGTERAEHYTMTNDFMTKAEVIDVMPDGRIAIIILEHEYDQDAASEIYDVNANDFDLISSTPVGTKIQPVGNTVPNPSDEYELLVILGVL